MMVLLSQKPQRHYPLPRRCVSAGTEAFSRAIIASVSRSQRSPSKKAPGGTAGAVVTRARDLRLHLPLSSEHAGPDCRGATTPGASGHIAARGVVLHDPGHKT
jgi:hypothetical protein